MVWLNKEKGESAGLPLQRLTWLACRDACGKASFAPSMLVGGEGAPRESFGRHLLKGLLELEECGWDPEKPKVSRRQTQRGDLGGREWKNPPARSSRRVRLESGYRLLSVVYLVG